MRDNSPKSVTDRYRANVLALRAAQKPAQGTAAYSRYLNRPAGRRVAAAAHLVGMTPNQATVVSATLSGAGILLLAAGTRSVAQGVGVAVLLAAGYVMDSVDGQLARLRHGGSVSGEWLDHIVDCFKTSMLHLAVVVAWFRFPPVDESAALLVPLGYEVVQAVTFFGLILMPYLRQRLPAADHQPSGQPPGVERENPLRTWLILPTDYGALCWAFVLLGWPAAFFGVYTALAALSAAALALALRKWWRELRASEAAAMA